MRDFIERYKVAKTVVVHLIEIELILCDDLVER